MTADAIRERLDREPFEPFLIRSSSGAGYVVGSPHSVALMKSKIFIAEHGTDGWAELSYLHVSSIESVRRRAQGASGKRSKRK